MFINLIVLLLFYAQTNTEFVQASEATTGVECPVPLNEPDYAENIKNFEVIRDSDSYLPFLATLDIRNVDRSRTFCSGTYIYSYEFDCNFSDYFVLTSADCVKDARRIHVQFRAYNYSNKADDEGYPKRCAAVVRSLDIRVHENYNEDTNENNIALVRVTGREVISCLRGDGTNHHTETLRMPLEEVNYPTSHVYDICGRGRQEFDQNRPNDIAKCIGLPIIEQDECKSAYNNVGEDEMCAGCATNSACNVDPGSPFIYNNTIVAVVPKESKSCIQGYPVLLTKVRDHMKWCEQFICS